MRISCLASLLGLLAVVLTVRAASWEAFPSHRRSLLPVPAEGRSGFTRIPAAVSGVSFTNQLSEILALNNQILENGAGLALADVDGDGLCDLYLCGSENDNRLYRNLGQWRFEDVTARAGVSCPGQFSTGAVLADVNGDGRPDLLVNGLGVGTRCFLNDGQFHFHEASNTGLRRYGAATSLALADLNGDGNLDLYVTNYRDASARNDPNPPKITAKVVNGRVVVTPSDRFSGYLRANGQVEVVEKGEPDVLYFGDGHGRFDATSWTDGTFLDGDGIPLAAAPEEWGLSVMLRDLNGDGFPDIYVCNDFFRSRDELWLNDGRGHFRAIPATAWRSMPLSSMAIDVADINRDGHDDFLAVEMLSRQHRVRQYQRANEFTREQNLPIENPLHQPELSQNTLHLSRGDGTFAEIGRLAGLDATDWSWSAVFLDVDLDGWEDVLIANGNSHDVLDLDAELMARHAPPGSNKPHLAHYPALLQPNLAFRNRHDLTFEDRSAAWGFDGEGISQTLALGDLDGDGDLDVVVGNLNKEIWIYRNEAAAPRIAVRLLGRPPNTSGVGARIRVTGGPVAQTQTIISGGRYLSSDQALRVFAAGSSTNVLEIEVIWPDGSLSTVKPAFPNYLYEIQQDPAPSRQVATVNTTPAAAPIFEDVSQLLNHNHADEPFDDYARQPLLPKKLSQLGPGVSWFDVNGDGWDDLIVGSGRGGTMAVFQNDGHRGFNRLNSMAASPEVTRDQTAVLGWNDPTGQALLLAGSANYEDGLVAGPPVRQFNLTRNSIDDSLPPFEASTGPMAMSDVDGDGDLDLFVGGRVVPGRYPQAAPSLLFLNDEGKFKLDLRNNRIWREAGLVSGAVFTDLDGDGFPELVLACEWGPLRVFANRRGEFTETTAQLGLNGWLGFWNSVAAGDFDGDGRMDLVAGNWGRNTHQQLRLPWTAFYGEFERAPALDLVEAFTDPDTGRPTPWRERETMSACFPSILERYPTHRAYAAASVADLLGAGFIRAQQLKVNTLDSMVFLNRGDHFEARPLPIEAQFSPAFGLAVGDFNGDGTQDVFLAQNFFDTERQTARSDAGRGLLLLGDGTGGFRAAGGEESGLRIYGEQRGAAVSDFDGDGRLDLVVGQNRGSTRVFRNRSAIPGLRVRLHGPPGNPHAVGAALRLRTAMAAGPAQEIHAGAGYWSQDSSTLLFSKPLAPDTKLEIRWPGGASTSHPVSKEQREITLSREKSPASR